MRTENETLFIPKRQQRLLNDNQKRRAAQSLKNSNLLIMHKIAKYVIEILSMKMKRNYSILSCFPQWDTHFSN